MHDVEQRAQAEAAVLPAHEVGTGSALPTQRHRGERAAALDRHGVRIGEFGHRGIGLQKVPMLENIQYQNQMMSPVPPQAAT